MTKLRARFSRMRGRPVLGAIALHLIALMALANWQPKAPPAQLETIPIILVELPPLPQQDPVIEPVPEPALSPDDRSAKPGNANAPQSDKTPAPVPEQEIRALPELAPPANTRSAQPDNDRPVTPLLEALEASPEKPDIDPDYIVKPDPFAGTANSAIARVSTAVNCARISRETRPAFCPDYSDNELYLASLRVPDGSARAGYNTAYDISGARDVLARFAARQSMAVPNGRSEIQRINHDEKTAPDDNCLLVPISWGDAGGVDLGSSSEVYCY